MSAPSPATLRELQNPAPVGQRHAQIVRLSCRLRADGFGASEIFHRLRANYDAGSVPDSEIAAVIRWAEKQPVLRPARFIHPRRNPCPASFETRKHDSGNDGNKLADGETTRNRECHQAIDQFLSGFSFEEADLFDASPIRLPNDFRQDAALILETLYSPAEQINIVTQHREQTNGNGIQKAFPIGFGNTFPRNECLNQLKRRSVPQSPAGAWVRMNPVNENGISDGDISEFRFALLESDLIPVEIQISLFAKLPLPICAILKSGGKSIHAWVRIGATNAGQYRETVGTLFSFLSPFGFDTSNRNPSRLSCLPGAQRFIGANGDGKQRLLYLNPEATERSIA